MAFFARRASSCLKALGQAGARSAALHVDQTNGSIAVQLAHQCKRYAGGGGGAHGEAVTHAGLTLHKPSPKAVWGGKIAGALMWFWILYRFYWDFDVFVFGHAAHFEHEDAHHDEGHGKDGHHH